MLIDLHQLDGALRARGGFPAMDWAVVRSWIDANLQPPHRPHAHRDAERQWIGLMSEALGGDYAMQETDHVLALSEERGRRAEDVLDFAAHAARSLQESLDGISASLGEGRLILLRFTEQDDYEAYVRAMKPGAPTGVPITSLRDDGRLHFAVHAGRETIYEVLALGLAGALLDPLPLPAWVRQGVCAVVAKVAVGQAPPPPWDVTRWSQQRSFWTFKGFDSFWSGRSFAGEQEGLSQSLDLAEVLVRRANGRDPQAFNAFLLAANRDDNGRSAARAHLGCELSDLIDQVLGEAWVPEERIWTWRRR